MNIRRTVAIALATTLSLTGCAPDDNPDPAADSAADTAALREGELSRDVLEEQIGEATFYADVLDRRRTASGELLDQNAMVAAHRVYPFGTLLRVTNLDNDRTVRVRVIDRGPFGAPEQAARTVIDLSRRAAEQLGFIDQGRTAVRVEVLSFGEGLSGS